MQLKSLEKVLEGIGRVRAASAVAAVASAGALLGLPLSSAAQAAGLVAAAIVIAVVNVTDGIIRSGHVKALPALIAQGAESVARVQDPRVDAVAHDIADIAGRVAALESKPGAPALSDIIDALTTKTPMAAAPSVSASNSPASEA